MSKFDLRDISQRLATSKDTEAVVSEFLGYLQGRFGEKHESLVLSEIEDKDAIYESIKIFLGKGR